MKIKGVVFDWDGVLADTHPIHCTAWKQVARCLDVNLMEADYLQHRNLPRDDMLIYLCGKRPTGHPRLNSLERMAYLALKDYYFYLSASTGDYWYETGALELVRSLYDRVLMAVCSDGRSCRALLDSTDVAQYFSVILTSGDTPFSKPSPSPYQKVCERLAMEPSVCVAIEDSSDGVMSARSAGLFCISVDPDIYADLMVEGLDDPKLHAFLEDRID